jgi:hypothetical protein
VKSITTYINYNKGKYMLCLQAFYGPAPSWSIAKRSSDLRKTKTNKPLSTAKGKGLQQ